MIYYPVLIPTLNRFEHFKKCVESLAKCTHADQTELVIGLDFPPAEKYKEGWLKIKAYIQTIKGFQKLTIFEHTENLGAQRNEDFLRNYAFEHYDAYITTEDDNIFSPAFLDYMNKGLNYYKDHAEVAFISAYSYPILWETHSSVFLQHQYFSAWGFGEWKEKYLMMEKLFTPKYLGIYLTNQNNRLRVFNLSQKIYRYASIFLMAEEMPFHDAARCIYMVIQNKNVLMPKLSLVRNCGWDGSGLNCPLKYVEIFSHQKIDENAEVNLKEIQNAPIIESLNLEKYQQDFMGDFPHYEKIADEIYHLLETYGYEKAKNIYVSRQQFQKIIQELKNHYTRQNALQLKILAPQMAGLTLKQTCCLFFSKNSILWSILNYFGKITDKIRHCPRP